MSLPFSLSLSLSRYLLFSLSLYFLCLSLSLSLSPFLVTSLTFLSLYFSFLFLPLSLLVSSVPLSLYLSHPFPLVYLLSLSPFPPLVLFISWFRSLRGQLALATSPFTFGLDTTLLVKVGNLVQ